MAKLVECKTCKKEVANGAKVCPHCGQKNPTIRAKDTIVGILVVAAVIFVLVSLPDSKKEEKAPVPSKTIYKKDYADKWPFKADSAVIKCYKDDNIESPVVEVNGVPYGLTGFANIQHGKGDINAINKVWLKDKKRDGLYVDLTPVTDAAFALCKEEK